MKRLIATFSLLLTMIAGASAQNDAMYVYRNDGVINAFLKTDIDSVRYSHLDLDSMFHKEYMVQEVWTVDSIYRIPLEVIDSVSFMTPPTIYKDDANVIDKSMLDYIISVDSLTLFFRNDTPKDILPSLNDKLVFMEVNDILPHGFLGQVIDIRNESEYIVVECTSISVTDVLEQFYSFYSVSSEQPPVRKADAGLSKTWGPYTYSPTPSQMVMTPLISPDIYPDPNGDFSFNVTPRSEWEIAPTYTGSAFLIVSPTLGVTFNINIKEEYKSTTTFNLSGKVDLTKDFRFLHFPVLLPIPLLAVYGEIGAFFRAEASGSFIHEHTQTLRNTLNVEICSRNFFVPHITYNNIELPSTNKTEAMLNGSVGVGFYAELGLEFLDKNFVNMGFRGEAGVKFEGNAVLYKKDSEKAFHSTEVYNNLLNTDIQLKWFYNVGRQAKFLFYGASHNFDGLSDDGTIMKGCPVPTFKDTKIERVQDSPTTLFASTIASGQTLPVDIGLTVFEGDVSEGVAEEGLTSYMAYSYNGPKSEISASFFDMNSTGGYTVYPTVRLWGIEMLAEPSAELKTHSCPDDHHPHAIDLGLPSGTKWACCNVGASSPEQYGGYYAWGETSEKSVYNWETYAFGSSMDKCQYIGLNIAGTQYDVAHVRKSGTWRMPTYEQQVELMNYCSIQWTKQNSVNGILVTGPNGGQVFFPAAGGRWDSNFSGEGSSFSYWSSSFYLPDELKLLDIEKILIYYPQDLCDAHYFGYDSDLKSWVHGCTHRNVGKSVRAVCQ